MLIAVKHVHLVRRDRPAANRMLPANASCGAEQKSPLPNPGGELADILAKGFADLIRVGMLRAWRRWVKGADGKGPSEVKSGGRVPSPRLSSGPRQSTLLATGAGVKPTRAGAAAGWKHSNSARFGRSCSCRELTTGRHRETDEYLVTLQWASLFAAITRN